VDRAEAETIYDQGREAVVAVLLRMDEQIQRLEKRVAAQDERIAQLERRIGRSSRNSSQPPSSDPPGKDKAPKRGKDRSGRKQGAQGGHEGKGRPLLPAWAVDDVVEHWPAGCGCGHVFSEAERVSAGKPTRHQVEELPGDGRDGDRASMPARALPGLRSDDGRSAARADRGELLWPAVAGGDRDLVDPQSCLASRRRRALRAAVLLKDLDGYDRQDPHDGRRCADRALHRSARSRPGCRRVEHGRTGWRLKGAQRALWGAFSFSDRHAVFQIAPSRHEDHARDLLGASTAIVTSDRWWAYNHLPVARRQVCWSHLQRDFAAHAEGLAAEKELGEHGLRICGELFWAWRSSSTPATVPTSNAASAS